MIISRAPLRISFIGGGSDYQSYFSRKLGAVIGGTINQYSFVYLNSLSNIADEKFRFTYRKTESVSDPNAFEHPVVRELLKYLNVRGNLNLGTFSDLPAGTGLGSSSAFTVALTAGLSRYLKLGLSKKQIARVAVEVERKILMEYGGWQDQFHACFGGVRLYKFHKSEVDVSDSLFNASDLEYFKNRFSLIWTGKSRSSSENAKTTEHAASSNLSEISISAEYAIEFADLITKSSNPQLKFDYVSQAINISWDLKKKFNEASCKQFEDEISKLKSFGAVSAKLCGAGGGGFILITHEIDFRKTLNKHFDQSRIVTPSLTSTGVEILDEESFYSV